MLISPCFTQRRGHKVHSNERSHIAHDQLRVNTMNTYALIKVAQNAGSIALVGFLLVMAIALVG